MTLTKAELADILVEKVSNISKNDAKEIVELFFEEIRATLERGDKPLPARFRFGQPLPKRFRLRRIIPYTQRQDEGGFRAVLPRREGGGYAVPCQRVRQRQQVGRRFGIGEAGGNRQHGGLSKNEMTEY